MSSKKNIFLYNICHGSVSSLDTMFVCSSLFVFSTYNKQCQPPQQSQQSPLRELWPPQLRCLFLRQHPLPQHTSLHTQRSPCIDCHIQCLHNRLDHISQYKQHQGPVCILLLSWWWSRSVQ